MGRGKINIKLYLCGEYAFTGNKFDYWMNKLCSRFPLAPSKLVRDRASLRETRKQSEPPP